MKDYTKDIMRYIDGLSVSKEFMKALETDESLIIKVATLKQDMFLMEKLENSKLENMLYEKKAEIIIKVIKDKLGQIKYKALSPWGFLLLYEAQDRNTKKGRKQSSYIYRNIETLIKDEKIYLKIKDIKDSCEIKKNKKTIIRTNTKDKIEMELEPGEYEINIANYKAQIIIKPQTE